MLNRNHLRIIRSVVSRSRILAVYSKYKPGGAGGVAKDE